MGRGDFAELKDEIGRGRFGVGGIEDATQSSIWLQPTKAVRLTRGLVVLTHCASSQPSALPAGTFPSC